MRACCILYYHFILYFVVTCARAYIGSHLVNALTLNFVLLQVMLRLRSLDLEMGVLQVNKLYRNPSIR